MSDGSVLSKSCCVISEKRMHPKPVTVILYAGLMSEPRLSLKASSTSSLHVA